MLLIGLLGLLMSLIARHVVLPVRQAARTAELVRAGHLEQRLPVRGEDDLAARQRWRSTTWQAPCRRRSDGSRASRVSSNDSSRCLHELRTLTTIRMASDVICESRETMPPSLLRSAELHDQLDRFRVSLLADLLEIGRFDAGAAQLETESTDLRVVVGPR